MRLFLWIALLFIAPLSANEPPLRVGMELSYPPFETICEKGRPCGLSVDMAKELAHSLNRELVIENIAFIGLIPALRSGSVDLVISSITSTEARKRVVDFSDPYASTSLALLVNARSTLSSIKEANSPNRIIVVKSGTSGEVYAAQHLPKATIRVLDKEATCVLEVVQGKADAFIYDQLSVYTNWQKHPETTRPVLTPFQKELWAVGVRKGNQKLLEQVNHFITKFKEDGGFDRLSDKYLPRQKAAFQELGIPFVL